MQAIRRILRLGRFLRCAPMFVACLCFGPLDAASEFSHFEARHCHPLDYSPDGNLLLAVNAPEGRLSIFATGAGRVLPLLIAEIPVGLEPVSVRAVSNDEAWVVNEVSDSVSVIDLAAKKVVSTFRVGDEPADVVFAHGKAFVSCARENRIAVIDVATRSLLANVAVSGVSPRTLALSPDGSRLYAGFLLSGNKTTTLHFRQAPAQPAPIAPSLPAAPQVALIVPDSDPRIHYQVIDHDIVEIDTMNHAVLRYHSGIGTNIHAIACAPDGSVWAAATEARNLIRFEPNLNGVFQESRMARVTGTAVSLHDLNSHASAPQLPEPQKNLSLAQPMAVLADADGAWVAAFGSDRLARLDASGGVIQRVDLRTSMPDLVRGPRGLARHPFTGRIKVLNKLSHTLSIVSAEGVVIGEVALASHQPIPSSTQRGRGFFYDSRLSGNGTVSCGSCHFDADIDGVAWDLGDPAGGMTTVTGFGFSIGEPGPIARVMHPMKGPMVTQPLRGIKNAGPFHWRGDKATIHEFNSSFSNLQAGQQVPAADMDKVVAYIESLRNHPNPHRMLDNSLPATLNGGNPKRGRLHFEENQVCSVCHPGPRGTNHILDDFSVVLTRQPVKNSTLEHVYKKLNYTPGKTTSLSGYGFTHDGTGHDIPRGHEYSQDLFADTPGAEADVLAFILCAETDTKPVVGHDLTAPSPVLHAQAAAGHCDVIAHAVVGGVVRAYLYRPISGTYQPASVGEASLSPSQLATLASSLKITSVPPGNGPRFSIDRDGDGVLNGDTPIPTLSISSALLPVAQPDRSDWFFESSDTLSTWQLYQPEAERPARQFFRLRRTW